MKSQSEQSQFFLWSTATDVERVQMPEEIKEENLAKIIKIFALL